MKKTFIYIGTIIISFVVVFALMFLFNYLQAKKIVKDFDKTLSSSDKQMVFYARTTCYFCQMQKPILKNIAKDYNLKYLNIDADKLTEKQKKHIIDKLGIDGSTPVTAIVQNNKVLATHIGYLDGKEYVDFLKENGMLPKNAVYNQEKYLTFIGYDEFKTIENGILVLGRNASPDCIDLRSTLNDIAKNNKYEISYLNLSQTTKDEFNDIMHELDYMNNKKLSLVDEDNNIILPLIIVINNNEITTVIDEQDKDKIITQLKKMK